MKKRKIVFVFMMSIMLLCGCDSQNEVVDDKKAFHYDATYSIAMNSLATTRTTTPVQEGILLFPSQNQALQNISYTVHYHDGKASIVNADVSTQCDFDNVSSCSSSFDKNIFNMYVYGDKLYYYIDTLDSEGDTSQIAIRRRNIDGSEDEELITEVINYENTDGMQAFSFTIHRNKLYYMIASKVYSYDLSTNKKSVLCELDGESMNSNMFFHGEDVYISTDYVTLDNKIYNSPILKVSLKDGNMSVWKEGFDPYYVSDQFLVYLEHTSNISTYFYDLKTDKKIKLLDDAAMGIYVSDSYIVVPEIMMSKIYLYNLKGELLDKFDYGGSGLPQGIMEDSFYIGSGDSFTRIEIKDGKFQNSEIIKLEE